MVKVSPTAQLIVCVGSRKVRVLVEAQPLVMPKAASVVLIVMVQTVVAHEV
jgi:hypothetical protein